MTREEKIKRLKALKARCERLIVSSDRGPEEWRKDAEALDMAIAALAPQNEAEKAIQRMGRFGKLFLDYSGDPRGQMGKPGASTDEEWATMMDPIRDVEGEWWRPVQEQALQNLICKVKSLELAPQNEPLTWEELKAETKINPIYSMKYGWIFPSTVKDEPYKQVWFFTSKGFANTELFHRDTFYRRPPERQEDTDA